ncbi:Peptidase S41 [uncultured Sphingopyxis sp.]|uniref:Peptidase S41 n=1 Tax=uncultured Sphingopyxis sp. TaxID=310581 RepID=A0A1Y5Q276_9SPHN|nr:S41 family peptidase [uncultured Sphingopyxis sp.]SBV34996.1 Peptidase S41 [uncultured Sphingopyxis sp.]
MGKSRRPVAALTLAALMLASCGGGDGGTMGSGPVTVTPTPSPTPTPTPTCALASRQAFAKAEIDEWYLFPGDVASGVNPGDYGDVQTYIDALVKPAFDLNKDRGFTYITSIAEENAFISRGSNAGFGILLAYDAANQRIVIAEAYEGTPALAAGIDRGTAIVGIGTNSGNVRTVASIVAAEGRQGLTDALGPNDPGVSRVLRITDAAGTREVTVTKADYALDPVSDRYGAKIISEGGRRYGYLNLRSFIEPADNQLTAAFADFRAQGVTDIIIDFRYNGGGLVATANLMGDLLGRNRNSSEIFSQTRFRAEKSVENDQHYFPSPARPESIAPTRIAFIGTGSTASASELVINSMLPYLGTNMTLVGSNTYGKPVGQIARDKRECDDRMRVVAFATGNADGQSDYYDGLAPKIANSCAANDDLAFPLGDPREASIRAAIDFLAGNACTTRIADANVRTASRERRFAVAAPPAMLVPERPSAAQRELPGLF